MQSSSLVQNLETRDTCRRLARALVLLFLPSCTGVVAGPSAGCPAGFVTHASGYWQNGIPGPPTHPTPPLDHANNTPALCAAKCQTWNQTHNGSDCVAFELNVPTADPSASDCYVFPHPLQLPFTTDDQPVITTCVVKGYHLPPQPSPPPPTPSPPPSPPPGPPPPQRGRTNGHTFPRLSNIWGDDPYISTEQWAYHGFHNITNTTWAEYDVLYLNPFDSCCWVKQMNNWAPRIKAIKEANPKAVVFATFHATEIWSEDLIAENRWLPDSCLLRNADGSLCSWWVGLVFTNNLFRPECLQAAVDNALDALGGGLLAAGVDGVFLDGVTDYNTGCASPDINCTSAQCKPTPQPNSTVLSARWAQLYGAWFAALKAKYPKLLWVNNMGDDLEPALMNISNGRQQEGSDPLGLDGVYAGQIPISKRIALSRQWSVQALQPSYVHMSMNADVVGPWRIGRWQNLVTRGEAMRLLTDFRRMRFGLGVTLMTDSYFGNDLGGGWYGVPSYYAEYEASLGQALADPVCVFSSGVEEVWTREFETGFVAVSSITSANFTLELPLGGKGLRPLPLSRRPDRITDQREAPAWQFVVDNGGATGPTFSTIGTSNRMVLTAPDTQTQRDGERQRACVCSSAAPACCPHATGRPLDWWAGDSRRAGFRIVAGKWTTVSDQAQSHQVGNDFVVSFVEPGPLPQGVPPAMEAAFHFVSPATDTFNFAMTDVDPHLYPLTDAAQVCVRERLESVHADQAQQPCVGPCIASGVVNQMYQGPHDGRWQRALSAVPLKFNSTYEFSITWNALRGGYVAVDALLVESTSLYNGGDAPIGSVAAIGPMDSRIFIRDQ